jgi:hypothetical protein
MPHAMTEDCPLLDPPEHDVRSRQVASRVPEASKVERRPAPGRPRGTKAPARAPVSDRSV